MKNTYHAECRTCRRECDRAKKAEEWKSSANRFCRETERFTTADALHRFIDRFCDELKTTPFDLFANLADYSLSDACTPCQRHKIARAILHIQATAELAIAEAQPTLDTPEKVVRKLHRTHRLVPTLREMYAEGAISLDALDPPPPHFPLDDDDF